MEDIRWRLIAAVAPLAWGTTYVTTEQLLPADRPMFSAVVRALPAGVILLAVTRRLPRGDWWWRAAALGVCNIGLFFPLIFLAAYRLPGGLAATLQAASPIVVMALAHVMLRERLTVAGVLTGLVGLAGVALLVLRSPGGVDALGLAGALGSVLVSGFGFVLLKRWRPPVPMLTLVSWQLVAGGAFLLPIALVVEGAPPHLDAGNVAGFLWLGGVGTVLAYVCWFGGLTHLPAGAVSLVGLLNPIVGTVLGVVVVHEAFGPVQALGVVLVLGSVVVGQRVTKDRGQARAPIDADSSSASTTVRASSAVAASCSPGRA